MSYDLKIIESIRSQAIPLNNDSSDYDVLFTSIGDAQIVMLGEATHGTREFYDIRAQISKRLINEKGFHAIAIEGDWPDAYEVNRYIHQEKYNNAIEALSSFDRFPTWMWRNHSIVQFVDWLYEHNQEQTENKVGFYGLDLYSLYRSIDVIISCIKKIDPAISAEVQSYYSCFDQYRHDPQAYGYAVVSKAIGSCAEMVVEELKRLQQQTWQFLEHNKISANEAFYINQNALVVKNAENYYRSLFVNETSNWNIRDSHMLETVNALIAHYKLKGIEKPKIIIWAHNSHVGNAAATQMGEQGEYNIGQLVKEQFGIKAFSLGFTTYDGTVSAATDWHQPVERKMIRNALEGSYERLFHAAEIPNFLLLLNNMNVIPHRFLERAIGVVYRPETERMSHYFYANLSEQFDAVIHCDRTTAIEPLEKSSQWIAGEIPETYPSGI